MSKSPLPEHDVPTTSPPDAQIQDSPTAIDTEKQQEETPDASKTSAFKGLGWLDRFLAVWIFLAMAVGIILGNFVPRTGPALQKQTFVGVSVPIGIYIFSLLQGVIADMCVAVGLLLMMYPIMCKVRFETLHYVFRKRDIWIQIGFSIIVNWIIAPLLMVCTRLILCWLTC